MNIKNHHVFSLKCGIVTDEEMFTIMSTSLENKEVKELKNLLDRVLKDSTLILKLF